jgi:peptide/nickel transport system substrate-binding protein
MMGKKRHLALLGAVAAVALSLVGCAPSAPNSTAGAKASDNASLTVDIDAYPATLDPGLQYDTDSYTVYRNIFDQLVRRDPSDNKIVPWLATKWKPVNDTTWQFTMRKGVKFSNGTPLTAKDAAFSIERILDPATASAQAANFAAIASATASGSTLTIKTKSPSPTLLTYLTTLSVVPEAYVKKVGNTAFNTKPIGSGAYKFVSDIAGSQVVLTRNNSWWGPKPQIKDVVFRAVPEVASRVADLQSGKAQIATALTSDTATQLKGQSSLQVLSAPTERVSYLAFNTIDGGPTNNVDVRKAISMAIDYKSLIQTLEGGYAKAVNSVATPLNFGYPKSLPNYRTNIAAAKKLVQASGDAGKTIIMATSPTYDPQIVQAVQANIQAIGLNVSIESTDQATYLKKVQSPTHNWGSIRFGQWSCSCEDADGVAYPLFRTGTVWSSYSNPQFDKDVDNARNTIDTAARTKLYSQAYGILADDVPGIGLFQMTAIYGATKNLKWQPYAQQSFFVSTMTLPSS